MDVAIVGAGVAGAGAAYALRSSPARVVVLEGADHVGGRTAARHHQGCTYDPGANYLKADDPRVAHLVTETLDTAGLVDIQEPVWTFDAEGSIGPGDDRDEHKWTYETGLSQLIERLLDRTDATVRTGRPVTGLTRVAGEWRLRSGGEPVGRFDQVVLTPPAPTTAPLLEAEGSSKAGSGLVPALEAVPYRPVVSALLHYPFRIERPFYGLVNVDREHPISWVSREEAKRGHVPAGESLLVVQLSPEPSRRRLGDGTGAVCGDAAELVSELLADDRLAEPDWTDSAAWQHGLVDGAVGSGVLDDAAAVGLQLAGDWVAGEARVHAALRSGLETGDRLARTAAD